jgi:hypothetical protein
MRCEERESLLAIPNNSISRVVPINRHGEVEEKETHASMLL